MRKTNLESKNLLRMKIYKMVVAHQLPRLNEEIELCKKHWSKYHEHKKQYTNMVHYIALEQLKGVKMPKGAAFASCWYMPNKKQDPDNTYFGNKYLFDGLVSAGVLQDDRFEDVEGGLLSLPILDRKNPRLELYLIQDKDVFYNFLSNLLAKWPVIKIKK